MNIRREKREKKIFMMAAVCALILISAVCASGTGLTVLADSGYVTFSTSGYRTGENDAGGTITGSFTDGTVIQYRASTTLSSTNTTGTVYGFWSQNEITVPKGVTLLLPYSAYETEIGENFGEYDNTELSEDSGSDLGLEPRRATGST